MTNNSRIFISTSILRQGNCGRYIACFFTAPDGRSRGGAKEDANQNVQARSNNCGDAGAPVRFAVGSSPAAGCRSRKREPSAVPFPGIFLHHEADLSGALPRAVLSGPYRAAIRQGSIVLSLPHGGQGDRATCAGANSADRGTRPPSGMP